MYATITVPDSLDEKSPQSSLCMAGKELYKPCPDVSFTQVSVTNSSINGLHYLAYHMGNNAKGLSHSCQGLQFTKILCNQQIVRGLQQQ